jgi:hypothetical protein
MTSLAPEAVVRVQAAMDTLSAQGIHSVLAQFVDLHGVAKGKLVPLAKLHEWAETGAGFAGPSIWGTGLGRLGPRSEYYGRVQVDSLRPLPFMPGVAHAVCDGFAGGQALDTCSRQLLKAQLQRLQQPRLDLGLQHRGAGRLAQRHHGVDEGQRAQGLKLLTAIMETAPDAFTKMQKEAKADEH